METLSANIESAINWNKITTKKGDTMSSEKKYKKIVIDVLVKLDAVFPKNKKCGSQQHIDLKNVLWNGEEYNFELKKVDKGNTFKLNDTIPKPDVYYIYLFGCHKKVVIKKGDDIPEEFNDTIEIVKNRIKHTVDVNDNIVSFLDNIIINCERMKVTYKKTKSINFLKLFTLTMDLIVLGVGKGMLSLEQFSQMIKVTYKFGNYVSRPRPNWTLFVDPFADGGD